MKILGIEMQMLSVEFNLKQYLKMCLKRKENNE